MTKTLILMRHAKSDWGDPSLSDHDRPLNRRGQRDAPTMATWLQEQGFEPELILCSSALRTRQTAELMQGQWRDACECMIDDSLYLAKSSEILQSIQANARGSCVLVLAHNPGISHAAATLSGESTALPTAAVVILSCDIENWSEPITAKNASQITQMRPKALT